MDTTNIPLPPQAPVIVVPTQPPPQTAIGLNPQDNANLPSEARDQSDPGKSTGQWDHRNLTYSIDTPIDAATQAALNQALDMFRTGFSAQLGFTFTQVKGSSNPDIHISLGTVAGKMLGQTASTSHSGNSPTFYSGTQITIEDPALHPIDPTTGCYAGTTATQLQVITHEIGHALGFGDSTDRWSIMDPNFSYRNDLHNGIDNGSVITAETVSYILYPPQNNDSLPPVFNFSNNEAAVYRFFDTRNGTQFMTSNVTERDGVINTRPDLKYEGLGLGSVKDATQDTAASPVYRFFDKLYGTHFFTTSATEAASVAATRPDMTQEAATVYEHMTQQAGDTTVYRFFDSHNGTHFYTSSQTEYAGLIQNRPDMVSEGVAFYAPKT